MVSSPSGLTTPKGPVAHGSRKIVTVLFVDMVDSTVLADDLDAESFRALMERYYEAAHDAVARHGGYVEKFIGDAVMAVFGIPKLHEEDALRAVTAAVELRDRIDALNEEFLRAYGRTVAIRSGVESGEAMASQRGWGELYVTGPTVQTAARLEQAAFPGTVLIGDATYHLVRDAVVVAEPMVLALKGKRGEVTAWAVQRVIPGAAGLRRRLNAVLVDRQDELRRLLAAFDRAASYGCQLVTVLGDAGIGKTRLVKELIARLEERARVLTGRCLPYGEGITFWPVVEVLRDVAGITATDSQADSIGKLRALLGAGHEGELITARLAGLMGDEVAQPAVQELFWAIRKLLEQLARTRPVVVVFDDIHFAEPTFLHLLEYLADWAGRAPILVVCLARGELLDVRPDWATPRPNAELIPLLPLSDDETRQLVGSLVGGDRVDAAAESRISTVAEGNPLFVEELLRMLADSGQLRSEAGQWVLDPSVVRVPIPATIQALMSARLEGLEPDQLEVLERAAVVGEVFGWSAVAALSDGDAQAVSTAAHLQALMRKQLIRPRRDDPGDEDAFEFSHGLVRDAAYRLIPKADRVDLHERFATWVENVMSEGSAAYEEIEGYHLERAHHTLLELGPESPRSAELAERAFARLSVAGLRAHARGDMPAAVNLLDRAMRLLDQRRAERTAVLPMLAFALMETGAFGPLQEVVAEIEEAAKAGDNGMRARAAVLRLWIRLFTDPVGWAEVAQVEAGRAVTAFVELRDDRGLAMTSSLLGLVSVMRGRFADAEARWTEASLHARQAGDQRDELEALSWVPLMVSAGPTPSEEALQRCHEVLLRADGDKKTMASSLMAQAVLEAGLGSFHEARGSLIRAHDLLDEVALTVWLAGPYAQSAGWVELLAGEPRAAERALRAGFDTLREIGEMTWFSTVAGLLGEAVLQAGRRDEAEVLAEASHGAAAPDDVYSQVVWRTVASTVHAYRGRAERAEALAQEAVDLILRSDGPLLHWYAFTNLARVLELLGRIPDAASAADKGAEAARLKGGVVAERRARETATRLRA
jgi:class 3 adenylate cyclase/tetratricopeptide (TPR) repeat protein